jgi:hypothetical protein
MGGAAQMVEQESGAEAAKMKEVSRYSHTWANTTLTPFLPGVTARAIGVIFYHLFLE